jgi:hypothetical protein
MSQTRAQLVKGFSNTSGSDDTITVDSSGQVGVGKTSPAGLLHIAKSGGNAKLLIQRSNTAADTNDYGSILWQSSAGNNNAAIGVARHSAENDGYMFFSTASGGSLQEELRIQSAGGISFNGDTAAANALGDYEVGTFTGTFNNQDNDATVSQNNQTGFYVKVGDLVHFSLYFDDMDISSTGSINTAHIFGLPFTSLSTNFHYSVVTVTHNTIITDSTSGYVNTNSTTIIPTNSGTNTTSTFSTGNGFRLMVGGTYRAA